MYAIDLVIIILIIINILIKASYCITKPINSIPSFKFLRITLLQLCWSQWSRHPYQIAPP
jgi:hypothetical protein